jgi:hypothetical protein
MYYVITYLVYIVAAFSTRMVVHLPHEEISPDASEPEYGGGSTAAPEWQLRSWDDYDFPDGSSAGGGDHLSIQV